MAKKNAFNTVTPISKTIALIMFVSFPIIGFFVGIEYQRAVDQPIIDSHTEKYKEPDNVACTLEAKLCPDGSAVGRKGPNCEFEKCPGE